MDSKYRVFEWEQYYPLGGWNDYKCSFDLMADVEAYHAANPLEWAQRRQVVSPGGGIVVIWRGED